MVRLAAQGWVRSTSTVATQMNVLWTRKKLLRFREGRCNRYQPTVEEPQMVAEEIETFLDIVIHDDPELLDLLEERAARRRLGAQAVAAVAGIG